MQFYEGESSVPDERVYRVRLLGTGSSVPTKEIGQGVTLTRTSAGLYKLTFTEGPGTFVGFYWGLGAATPGDVKQHTVTRDTPATSATGVVSIEVSLWNSSGTIDDLQATEYMDLAFVFSLNSEIA